MFTLRSSLICLATLLLGCTSQAPVPTGFLDDLPSRIDCADAETVPILDDGWDPEFRGEGISRMRAVGGFYRSLAAARLEQHRSVASFRAACGEQLELKLLLGVPPSEALYEGVLIGFLDYRQIDLELDGVAARRHQLTLTPGREHVLNLTTPTLPEGVHRLALIVFDDDQLPGFFGWHDMLADVYVGASPAPASLPSPPDLPSRSDPAIQQSNYGVFMTVTDDRLRLAGVVSWRDGLELYASVYGSVRDGDRPVVLVVLQGFEELPGAAARSVMARAGEITVVPFSPRRPTTTDVEPIRAIVFTNPDRPMAPNGFYDTTYLFISLASQKAYISDAHR